MSNTQPIEDYFRSRDEQKTARIREQAYALELRRRFEAGVDRYFTGLKRELTAGIGALRSRAVGITENESDETWQAIYGDFDVEIRLDKKREEIIATYRPQWRGDARPHSLVRYELSQLDAGWKLTAEDGTVVVHAAELLTPFLALAFPA